MQITRVAKSRKPQLTTDARNLLVESYVTSRRQSIQRGGTKRAFVTVRALELLIRLSKAVAKLKFSDFVEKVHVEEASQLVDSSLLNLARDSGEQRRNRSHRLIK